MKKYYSNGKLLLTGEYVVLDGAKALALPTKYGQDIVVTLTNSPYLEWEAKDEQGVVWFQGVFDLEKFRLEQATYVDAEEKSEFIADTLMYVLQEARKLNLNFLRDTSGLKVTTNLDFPRDWGLGSSSTFINNVAKWAEVDAYQLLWNAFSGSGYDIACAQHDSPILYQINKRNPIVEEVVFDPIFKDQLFFVHLNQKQDSREGITRYKDKRQKLKSELKNITEISEQIINCKNVSEFEVLLNTHENIISSIVELPKVQDRLFSDYFGVVKSLGAWGGDFVLATGNENTPSYFKKKGFETVISFDEMIL